MAMTVDEIIQRARRGGYSPGLADYNTMADEVESLRAEMARMRKRCIRWQAVADGWRDIADQRLKVLEDMPAPDTRLADQAARIVSLQGEIGKWAVAYNELHERLTTANVKRARDQEGVPEPQLADPVPSARQFADALVGIIQGQQRRIEVGEHEISRLRAKPNPMETT